MELYEYLLSRGADPSILSEDYDPYLNPGRKMPIDVSVDDEEVRSRLRQLEQKYKATPKVREPHPDIADWWALYDYGIDEIKTWDKSYQHPYPELLKRQKEEETKLIEKA